MAVSIQQVATRAGVSKAAVSMALRDHPNIPETRRQQIKKIARDLGYRPSMVAQTLSSQKTCTLGVVVPVFVHGVGYSSVAGGVELVAREKGYNIILCSTGLDLKVENGCFDLLYRRRVEGIVFVPGPQPNPDIQPLLDLKARGIPVVVANEKPLFESSFSTVYFDNVTVSQEMTQHLIRLGHRRIAFFHMGLSESQARWEGYCKGLAAEGIPYDESLVFQAAVPTANDDEAYRSQAIAAFLSRPDLPTAIFASQDMIAVKVMRIMRQIGLRVPEDIAVVGFDDMLVAKHLSPALTTVHQPMEEIGRRAAEILFERIDGKRADTEWPVHERIPVKIIVRESCGSSISISDRK